MHKAPILVTCPKGIPPLLKQELISSGFRVLAEHIAGIETEGTLDDAQQLNLLLRTGHRVLFLLKDFTARNADAMYRQVAAINWEAHVPEDGYLCVTSSVDNPTITDSRYATVRCKDAIVDRMREKTGRRPDSGPERDRSVIHLYWKGDHCSLYLDTSGESLSRRGYRMIPLGAPMQETLAAAVILATGWEGSGIFINPMCGSGTLAIEAALIGLNHAPGLLRSNFGFMHFKDFNAARWLKLREKAMKEVKRSLSGRIIATDRDPAAVDAARKNAATAGVEHLIEFSVCDFADTSVPDSGGLVVMNPEYGERMGEVAKLEGTYKAIGDFLKQKCLGYRGYVFTGSSFLAKKVGLKPRRTMQFFNSGIECRLLEYELYEGSRKKERRNR
jgi:23S rRNA G2445 N2-methylase RlmL